MKIAQCLLLVVIVFLLLSLTGCKSHESDILGKWEPTTESRHFDRVEFFKDGTISITKTNEDSRYQGVGDYKFVDETHVRIANKLSEAIFEFKVTPKSLELKDNDGHASTYSKVNEFKPLPVIVTGANLRSIRADLLNLATCIEAYSVDNNKYPKASGSVKNLKPFLEPWCYRNGPVKDAWDNEFQYLVSEDLQHYWIISYGTDNKPDINIYDSKGFPKDEEVENSSYEQDIIFSNGSFLRYPTEFKE